MHMQAHACLWDQCTVVACECTCLLLGGLPLPPGKAMLRFLSSVLTIFLYAGNHMDPGSRPESPSFLLW